MWSILDKTPWANHFNNPFFWLTNRATTTKEEKCYNTVAHENIDAWNIIA